LDWNERLLDVVKFLKEVGGGGGGDKQNQVEWMNADENPAGLLLLLLLLFVIVRVDVSIHGLINGLCRSLIRAIVSSNKFDTRP